MSETNTEVQNQPTESNVSPELANMMEQSLANWNKDNGSNVTKFTPPVQNQEPKNDAPPLKEEIVVDYFEPFKTKYGYSTADDAFKEIDELRASRERFNAPTSIEDIEFENPESEKLYRAVVKGDKKEVFRILEKQERLDSFASGEVNKANVSDIIKYGLQLKYPSLTQQEVDFQYNQQYAYPKEPKQPVQKVGEDEDVFAERTADWQERHDEWNAIVQNIDMKKIIDAKMLLPEFETAKAKLVLPDIAPTVDEGYENYKQNIQNLSKQQEQIIEAYKAFTPDTIGMKLNFKDEANKVDVNFDYKPSAESFKQTLEFLADFSKFFAHFNKSDGTPDREAFAQAVHFAINRKDILTEAMKQSKNGTLKSNLPDNSKGGGGMVRQLTTNEKSVTGNQDFDALMKQSLAVR
jgi:hypothetical protein